MRTAFPIVLFALLLPSPAVAQGACGWDLAADWSNSLNPNGEWSYNAGPAPIFSNQPNWAGTTNPGWAAAANGFGHVPVWARVTQTGASNLGPDAIPGVIVMHANDPANGTDVDLANVTWTSPITAPLWVHGDLWHTDAHNRACAWALTLNSTTLDSGNLTQGDPFGPTAPRSFSIQVNVNVGDVIKLEFKRNDPFGTFVCTRLAVTYSPLFLASPVFGVAGQANTLQVRGATPGSLVGLAWSLVQGSSTVAGCAGLTGCLQSPNPVSLQVANGAGRVSWTVNVPAAFAGQTVYVQALQPSTCWFSNLVCHRF